MKKQDYGEIALYIILGVSIAAGIELIFRVTGCVPVI